MVRRRSLLFAALVAVSVSVSHLASGRASYRGGQPGAPRVVYLGLSKNLRAEVPSSRPINYACANPVPPGPPIKMLSLTTSFTLRVSPNPRCDEPVLPDRRSINGTIKATWQVTVRNLGPNSFGTHDGTFTWTDGPNRIEGQMHGTIGCGTHRPPLPKPPPGEGAASCEACRAPRHFEGLLVGRYVAGPILDKFKKGAPRVQASYAGQFAGDIPQPKAVQATLDGVHILPCLQ